MAHPIKKFIYHHTFTAKIYYFIRSFRHDRHNWMSDKHFAKWYYHKNTGKKLNLKEPKSFDEKIWYLKLYDKDPLKTKCSDKLGVREYVKECGLGFLLNDIYAVYDKFEEIDFKALPGRFFLKCTHTSGCNVIYDASKEFDYEYYKHEFDFWLRRNYYWESREWNYASIPHQIVCERVLEDRQGKLPWDYKFFCFDGEVKLLTLDIGVADSTGEHAESYYRNVYDKSFNLLPVKETRENYPQTVCRPENYENMVRYAEILSKPFRHCRVDLYNVDGKVYFGELTFHHGGGCNQFQPKEFGDQLGQYINLEGIGNGD